LNGRVLVVRIEAKEKKDRAEDALNATRAAVEEEM
jgi:chaperonin GroEL (HSP60 family)